VRRFQNASRCGVSVTFSEMAKRGEECTRRNSEIAQFITPLVTVLLARGLLRSVSSYIHVEPLQAGSKAYTGVATWGDERVANTGSVGCAMAVNVGDWFRGCRPNWAR
jgi:hypothetical protein